MVYLIIYQQNYKSINTSGKHTPVDHSCDTNLQVPKHLEAKQIIGCNIYKRSAEYAACSDTEDDENPLMC